MENKSLDSYLCKSQIIERDNWTEMAIKELLGEPDKTKPNPKYKRAAPMKLYLESRVDAAEQNEDFQMFVTKNSKRRAGAKLAIVTKTNKAIEYASNIEIEVPSYPKKTIIELACQSYNSFQLYKQLNSRNHIYYHDEATPDSDVDFLERICVNYIRHQLTKYEEELNNIKGVVGKGEAYAILKKRINSAIGEQYPWLKNEAEEQTEEFEY